MLQTHGHSLDEESLQTLMAETEVVINSQLLTVNTIREQQGFRPSSPNNLLTTKSKEVMPPPGVIQRQDVYCRQMEKSSVYNK